MNKPERTAIMISGGGSTMEAVLKAPIPGIEVVLVIATKLDAGGIGLAVKAGMPERNVVVMRKRDYSSEEAYADRLIKLLDEYHVTLLCLLGCLVRIPDKVIRHLKGRVLNQHPGPLDTAVEHYDFGGDGMHGKRVHAARLLFVAQSSVEPLTYATVHWIAPAAEAGGKPEYDRGVVVGEERVVIPPQFVLAAGEGDSGLKWAADKLQMLVLPREHALVKETLRRVAEGPLKPIVHEPHWLVQPGQKSLLDKCKRKALELYPPGK